MRAVFCLERRSGMTLRVRSRFVPRRQLHIGYVRIVRHVTLAAERGGGSGEKQRDFRGIVDH